MNRREIQWPQFQIMRLIQTAIRSALILVVWGCFAMPSWAGIAELAWEPNSEPDLAGYKIYYWQEQGDLKQLSVVGLTNSPESPQHTLTGLNEGENYYFVISAYDSLGNESSPSEPVSKFIALSMEPEEEKQTPQEQDRGVWGFFGGGCGSTSEFPGGSGPRPDQSAFAAGLTAMLFLLGKPRRGQQLLPSSRQVVS